MKKLVNGTRFLVFLSLTMLFSAAVPAQVPAKRSLPVQDTTDVQAPDPNRNVRIITWWTCADVGTIPLR
jgi:hypothetical protein